MRDSTWGCSRADRPAFSGHRIAIWWHLGSVGSVTSPCGCSHWLLLMLRLLWQVCCLAAAVALMLLQCCSCCCRQSSVVSWLPHRCRIRKCQSFAVSKCSPWANAAFMLHFIIFFFCFSPLYCLVLLGLSRNKKNIVSQFGVIVWKKSLSVAVAAHNSSIRCRFSLNCLG